MADVDTTIQELIDCVAAFEAEREWRKFHSPKNLAMGIAIETGELLEHFQWISEEESVAMTDDPEEMKNLYYRDLRGVRMETDSGQSRRLPIHPYRDVLDDLQGRLASWQREIGDPALMLDSLYLQSKRETRARWEKR